MKATGLSPYVNLPKALGLYKFRKTHVLYQGTTFSRAEKYGSDEGFSLWGMLFLNPSHDPAAANYLIAGIEDSRLSRGYGPHCLIETHFNFILAS